MEKSRLYFAWEKAPAVIEPVPEGSLGFFISDDAWMPASPAELLGIG